MHVRSSSDEQRTMNRVVHTIDISPIFEAEDELWHSTGVSSCGYFGTSSRRDEGSEGKIIQGEHNNGSSNNNNKPPAHAIVKIIIRMAWKKFLKNPNSGACLLGLARSLISVKFKLETPTMLQGCVLIITNKSLLSMYSLGLFTGLQPKIVSCGKKVIFLSLAAKFLFAPLLIAATSLALGLRGIILNIAILQAALPPGIDPFVLMQEYSVHPNTISTGVILGLLVAIPVVLVYKIVLEKLQ